MTHSGTARRSATKYGRGLLPVFALLLSANALAAASADLVKRGKYLADAGDCVACHTQPGGADYAGGLALNTPFGPLVSPNITSDKATGIGTWTDEQFYKAMHDGIGKHGEYLYPAMPFPWYTQVSRADDLAIKAYLFSLPPVNKPREPSGLSFPFNVRSSLAAWRELFFVVGPAKKAEGQTAQVARGDYLVNGLGHCGACHNSRLIAGQSSKFQKPLQGGVIDSWYAPNITSDTHDGIGGWSDDQLFQYLKTGAAPDKGAALGPMAETVKSLALLSDDDLHAMTAYLKSTKPVANNGHDDAAFAGAGVVGAQAYLSNCAFCHGVNGKGLKGVVPPLVGDAGVLTQGPENVIHVVLGGLEARKGYAPMLAIGAGMSDQDVADVVNYVRQTWGNNAPATATATMAGGLRGKSDTLMNASPANGCPSIMPKPLAQAIEDPAHGIKPLIAATNDTNLPQQVDQIVVKLKAAKPVASQAEIVNGLTSAYCAVVREDSKLDANAKALRLGHFSELIYTRLSSQKVVAAKPK